MPNNSRLCSYDGTAVTLVIHIRRLCSYQLEQHVAVSLAMARHPRQTKMASSFFSSTSYSCSTTNPTSPETVCHLVVRPQKKWLPWQFPLIRQPIRFENRLLPAIPAVYELESRKLRPNSCFGFYFYPHARREMFEYGYTAHVDVALHI
jgi:hypothetical protein